MSVWLGAEVRDEMVHWDDGHVDSMYAYDWLVPGEQQFACLAWDPTAAGPQGFMTSCDTHLGVMCVTGLNAPAGKLEWRLVD